MPFKKREQPRPKMFSNERPDSRLQREPHVERTRDAFSDLQVAYQACQKSAEKVAYYRSTSKEAKEWCGIIGRRLERIKERGTLIRGGSHTIVSTVRNTTVGLALTWLQN